MPELPEMETIRHDLEREVAGKRIKTVTVTGRRSVRRAHVAAFTTRLEGRRSTPSAARASTCSSPWATTGSSSTWA